jgi:hypothetical protein
MRQRKSNILDELSDVVRENSLARSAYEDDKDAAVVSPVCVCASSLDR